MVMSRQRRRKVTNERYIVEVRPGYFGMTRKRRPEKIRSPGRRGAPVDIDLTAKFRRLSREAIARAVRALDEDEGLALIRNAYGFSATRAKVARYAMMANVF